MQSIEIRRQTTTLTGGTPATILTAIASGKSAAVVNIEVTNLDSASVTAILSDATGEIERVAGIPAGATEKDAWCSENHPIHREAGDVLTMALTGSPAATQPVVRVYFRLATDSV